MRGDNQLRDLICITQPTDSGLLVAARTSTPVLDQALRRAAGSVGGASPTLIARFKNSLNRAFHNISVSEAPGYAFIKQLVDNNCFRS